MKTTPKTPVASRLKPTHSKKDGNNDNCTSYGIAKDTEIIKLCNVLRIELEKRSSDPNKRAIAILLSGDRATDHDMAWAQTCIQKKLFKKLRPTGIAFFKGILTYAKESWPHVLDVVEAKLQEQNGMIFKGKYLCKDT